MISRKILDRYRNICYTTTCKEKNFTGGVFMEEVNELFELAMLYDFYGELLKEHNKQIFEDYI